MPMQLQIVSILLTADDGSEQLHEEIRLKNIDDLTAEKECARRGLRDREANANGYLTVKVWAACKRLSITTEPYQVFANRIVDFNLKLVDVDPTQLAGPTTSPSPSPASTAHSSSGSPAPVATTA